MEEVLIVYLNLNFISMYMDKGMYINSTMSIYLVTIGYSLKEI